MYNSNVSMISLLRSFNYNFTKFTNDDSCKFSCTAFANFSDVYDPIHKPLALLICLFGISANAINLVVLTRSNMVTATNIVLTGLSAAQLFLVSNYLSLLCYNYLAENCLFPSKDIFLVIEFVCFCQYAHILKRVLFNLFFCSTELIFLFILLTSSIY